MGVEERCDTVVGDEGQMIQASTLEVDFWEELAQIKAESIGWIPLEQGVYLHLGEPNAIVIEVVGIAKEEMAGSNVLWLV